MPCRVRVHLEYLASSDGFPFPDRRATDTDDRHEHILPMGHRQISFPQFQ